MDKKTGKQKHLQERKLVSPLPGTPAYPGVQSSCPGDVREDSGDHDPPHISVSCTCN